MTYTKTCVAALLLLKTGSVRVRLTPWLRKKEPRGGKIRVRNPEASGTISYKDYSYIRRFTGVFIYLFPFMGDVVRGCMRAAIRRSIADCSPIFLPPRWRLVLLVFVARQVLHKTQDQSKQKQNKQIVKKDTSAQGLRVAVGSGTQVSSVDSAHYRCPYASSDICPEVSSENKCRWYH